MLRRWNNHGDRPCQAIVREGMKNVAAGANPMDLKRASTSRDERDRFVEGTQPQRRQDQQEEIARSGYLSK